MGYFDGYYLKHTVGEKVYSFIVSYHHTEQEEYASVQFIHEKGSYSKRFNPGEFVRKYEEFAVQIGANRFENDGINVDIDFNGLKVVANIEYLDIKSLKTNVMGPFSHVPFVECKHEIVSMSHRMRGFLQIGSEVIDVENGIGYIEGDRGKSFPEKYLWTQSNFGKKDSFFLATATVKILAIKFNGVICEVLYGGKNYRLATYKGCKIIKNTCDEVELKQGKMKLVVRRKSGVEHELNAPKNGEMCFKIKESPQCEVDLKFYINGENIVDLQTKTASFECYQG